MSNHSTSWRHLKIYSLVIFSIFSFQVLFQNFALAKETDSLNQEVRQAFAETATTLDNLRSSELSNGERWEKFLTMIGATLPAKALATWNQKKERFYQHIWETNRKIQGSTLGICEKLAKRFFRSRVGVNDKQAAIGSAAVANALGLRWSGCVRRAKEKGDNLDFPDLPHLSWIDDDTLTINDTTTLTLPATGTTISVESPEGATAKLDLLSLAEAANQSNEALQKRLDDFELDLSRIETNWLQKLLLPNAYAFAWHIVVIIVVFVALLISGLIFNLAKGRAEEQEVLLYRDLTEQANLIENGHEGEVSDLVDTIIEHLSNDTPHEFLSIKWRPSELLIPVTTRSIKSPVEPDPEAFVNATQNAWIDFMKALANVSAKKDPSQLPSILNHLESYFMSDKRLHFDLFQALCRIMDEFIKVDDSDDLPGDAVSIKQRLLNKTIGW